MASNNRKETNTTNTDKDKMENNLAEDFENNAELFWKQLQQSKSTFFYSTSKR